MAITLKLRMISLNICRKDVDNVGFNISPWNIFLNMLLPARFVKIVRLLLEAVSINGLNID